MSLAIFTGLLGTDTLLLGHTVEFIGDQTNVDLRQAGMVVMLFNLVLVLGAIISIVMTVPKGGGSRDLGAVAASAAPAPHLPMDQERQAVLDRIAALPTADLLEIEKMLVIDDLRKLDSQVLHALLEERRSQPPWTDPGRHPRTRRPTHHGVGRRVARAGRHGIPPTLELGARGLYGWTTCSSSGGRRTSSSPCGPSTSA
ncbi:hypothetical protein [Ornithinimicrobium cerasi]|uniref:hypothetical protein n=1 Tax=Ornithinimicrobium cerasi TaxID=2248773 RepID=UPI000EFEAF07|nr:hypothetical protein [Ornithinimicrobium cerasi]